MCSLVGQPGGLYNARAVFDRLVKDAVQVIRRFVTRLLQISLFAVQVADPHTGLGSTDLVGHESNSSLAINNLS